ncbi:glycosyl transferase [Echinicola pacifica]|uniref:Glycosyl transferase n=1 Tax=Echinicola pacifica TaxID=346377 RepID=A0A918QBP0_9BACT|nr:glycosyltransferase [Echinicola pacifica]GGZ40562.1 glycosyl transferase [Echinicola pacifica]
MPQIHSVKYAATVLVPFRNERHHLPQLLTSIQKLSYSSLEVIMIDDHSEDGGYEWLQEEVAKWKLGYITLIKSAGEGKKAALSTGVTLATSSIILTTDADCSLPEDWVQAFLSEFDDEKIQLVAGPVLTKRGEGWLRRFQYVEWSSVLLLTNFFFKTKSPQMCSGANLAYRKEAFYHLKGYLGNENLLSGDDAFLLRKVQQFFGNQAVKYSLDRRLLVWTTAADSLGDLMSQRIRWAGKWRGFGSKVNALAALLSFVFGLMNIASFGWLLSGNEGWKIFAVWWGSKLMVEIYVLTFPFRYWQIRWKMMDVLLASFIHPFYVFLVGIGTWFSQPTWKGRPVIQAKKQA